MAARRAEIACRAWWRLSTVVVGLGVVAFTPAASKLSLQATPALIYGQANDGLTIVVDNSGQDARGTVTISGSGGRTVYPIELPRGAHKQFIGYPLTSSENRYDQITCDLDTDRGSVHLDVNSNYYGEPQAATLEISDELGGLQFLDVQTSGSMPPRQASPHHSVYAKPEDAPGRLSAYRQLGGVVLGPGAERISDAAVQALTEYLIGGGRLMFVGGAAAQIFRDRRWAALIPLSGVHVETRSVALTAGGSHFSMLLDVQAGLPTPGSELFPGGVVCHPVGLGIVIAIPFDLLQGPIKAWGGRSKFLASLVAMPTGGQFAWPSNMGYGGSFPGYGAPGRYSRYYSSTSYPAPPGPHPTDDPFSFEPPQPTAVFFIILCYLVVVAPVNFFVLRKLRRSEWAWFTTPCISVIFAGFLLKLAAGLYAGKMMTAAQGTLVIAEAAPNAGVFRGSSQLFFPTGGSYDLKLSGVDWLASSDGPRYGPDAGMTAPIVALDIDQLIVPSLSVRNLQFKQIDYEQLVDSAGWVAFSVHRKGDSVDVTVTNRSPYALNAGTLFVEGLGIPILELAPGARKTVSASALSRLAGVSEGLTGYSRLIHRPILSAPLSGFRPGPQIGGEVSGRNGISLVAVGAQPTGGTP